VIPAEPPPDARKWVNAHQRMAQSMVVMLKGEEPAYELVQGDKARLYPMNHTIQLRLARALGANAVVHGAYGYNPALAPVDMDRVLPMLGFYQVAIERYPIFIVVFDRVRKTQPAPESSLANGSAGSV
jgi:hypothetical protein